ncbi:ParB/RepB/Spo0J family partition protein [Sphingomonas sanguinis]|uniref:ParB/RepB/Spo0J family partition protein n=1 Tax=Sphingomonas sanguinis TaxID=33051 RepID=A0A7Y7QZV9_9SPHN|nr:ParB/RepB/Spo0J family partition protein [Sphingomonas sanguinis]NNG54469.1 ParB/RepB/Spo0J family partition protein [Sphingomonas sanguinis]NVP33516.1 ParB/RepB/Spo0J family partition protein [Sphingomonas sanguinis]
MIQTVKLSKLRLSPINVRTAPDEQLQIGPMAASIEAKGVLQNLLVTPAKKPRGTFEVFDGGRRWRALRLLADRGTISETDYDVPVMVLTGEDAELSETSTATNFHQLKMTPAEECRAFQHFIGKSGDIDAVAKRFGVTRRFVEGRLRLAALAEPIFEALSKGEITLDIAKAYASTENREKQLLVWNTYKQSEVTADTIRRVIENETLKASDPIAILVGEPRYRAAGGKIDGDLFTDGNDRWVNPEIAHRLAGEIMENEARRIGEETGLAWIRPIASNYTHNAAHGLYRVILQPPELTEVQIARLAEIAERRNVLELEMQEPGLPEDEFKALDQEDDRLIAEAEAIENRPPALPDELKANVGAFLVLTPQGEMRLDSQFYSEQPIVIEKPAGPVTGEDDPTRDSTRRDEEPGAGSIRVVERGSSPTAHRPEAVAPGGKPLSGRLYDELAIQRRDILASCLLAQPALALDFALFVMIDARMCSAGDASDSAVKYGTTIQAMGPQDPFVGDMPSSRARAYLAEAHDGLDAAWTEHDSEIERFEAFRALDDDGKANWLAYIVALSLEAKPGLSNVQIPLHNRLATILEVDVAGWWRPTSENFFDRVNKGTILSLLHEIGGPSLTARHASLKKTEISESCQKLFAGELIVEPEVKEAALAWVPNAMRFLDVPGGAIVDPFDEAEPNGLSDDGGALPTAEDEDVLDAVEA